MNQGKHNKDIRDLLAKHDIKHSEIAEVLGISRFTLSHWLMVDLTDKQRKRIKTAVREYTRGKA